MIPNVLHISTPKSWRGGEQQMGYLILEQKLQEINPHVFCCKNSAVEEFCKKHEVTHESANEVFAVNPAFASKVARYCKANNIHLIHVHDSHAHTFAVMANVLFGANLPIIVSRRVDFPISKSALSRFKYNHSSVKKILCVSEAIKGIMAKDILRPERLSTVHSGIDLSRFSSISNSSKSLREEYNISTKLLIGNVAALAPHKDYRTFISAAESLLRKGVDATFFIIGDGPLRDDVTKWVSESSARENIVMTGFRNDIPSVLAQLDLFLITSETEGLGTSILDAFACGLPVVATRAGGIPEIVKHENTGLSVDVKDAEGLAQQVLRIIGNSALREQLKKGSDELLKMFTKEAVAEKTLQHYQEVLSSK